jgi:hypothetical protein
MKRNKYNILFITILYRLLLDAIYIIKVKPLWISQSYILFVNVDFNFIQYIISWLIFLVFIVMFYKILFIKEYPSTFIILFLFYISFIPFTTMIGLASFPTLFIFLNVLFWFILLFISVFKVYNVSNKDTQIEFSHLSYRIMKIISVFLLTFTFYIIISMIGFRIDLNLLNAYNYRFDVQDINYNSIVNYILGTTRILIPFLIIISIRRRDYFFSIFVIFVATINYSFDGSKTLYFVSILSILFAFIRLKSYKMLFIYGFIGIALVGLIDVILFDGIFTVLILRRLLFLPNLINAYYFDYIDLSDPNLYSQLLRFFGVSPTINIQYTIGRVYFYDNNMSANSGLIADSLWQLSYLGIIVHPILIAIYLSFFDFVFSRFKVYLYAMPAIIVSYYLNNSGIIAAFITHGLIVFLALILTFRYLGVRYENS